MKRYLPLLFLAAACSGGNPDKAELVITVESLQEPILVLADDSMQGRAPATPGEEKTVAWLIERFKALGLQPGMPDGSYIQDVPVLAHTTAPDAVITATRGGRTLHTFRFGSDMVVSPYPDFTEIDLAGVEAVFVGYGIQAPEENWDDYKDVDVRGKIVIFKNSDPYSDSTRFAGPARLYYGRWSYKFEQAQRMGAIGALIIHTNVTAGYPWAVVQNSFGRERFDLVTNTGRGGTVAQGWLSAQASVALFESAGLDLQALMDAAESPDFVPVSLGAVRLGISARATHRTLMVKNVVGVLPGSDAALKDDYVVFSAHHDHLGMAPTPIEGDSIYNGALDNASGISAFLNIADAFRTYGPTRRSLMFVAVGAEESGLLGAKHFAANPPVPPARMTANINIDGINIFGPAADIVSIGYGKNTLDAVLEAEAARVGRTVKPDAFPEQGFFYRSDHFAFAQIGVPAMYLSRGTEYIGKPADYAKEVAEAYNLRRYHTVHDEFDESWDLEGAVQDVRLLFRVALRVAENDESPAWYPGNEFEAARLRSQQP